MNNLFTMNQLMAADPCTDGLDRLTQYLGTLINTALTYEQCGMIKKLLDNRSYQLCVSNPNNLLDSMTTGEAELEKMEIRQLMVKLDPYTHLQSS